MTGRLVGARERARTLRMIRERIGRQVADVRTEAGATRADLARCAGIDPGHIWRVEAGTANPSLEALVALASCLGVELGVRLFPVAGARLHDRFQAPMLEALVRRLGTAWRPEPEVLVPAARGVIDLVLHRALDHLVIACECHSEVRRLDDVVRRLGEKQEALRGLLGATRSASSLLLLRSTRATREIAAMYESTLAAAFPARTAEVLDALRGTAAWPGPAIVWARVEGGRAEILDAPPRGVRLGR
jgi:transcriptional regulator with XRE-family HTH domain